MEYCIVYLSSSKGLLSDQDLARILKQSQQNNRALDITGILLYFNGSIIQVLEGSEERVKGLYEVISRDPQHSHVIKLYSYPIEQRSFSDWSMGYKTINANELAHLKDKLSFIDQPFSSLSREENAILALVQIFYENNYRN
ncbi:BLUF domain-containing protein [Spirosoma radiotolerans]|uniref:BLUF domain-containing protein n=1 Tax=Spirosoma radiotolerans TaxID=1379870 RepID=UPI0006964B27|nr:BLUF domain-containing protein [Spirosoma radiotolerans]